MTLDCLGSSFVEVGKGLYSKLQKDRILRSFPEQIPRTLQIHGYLRRRPMTLYHLPADGWL